MLHFTDQAIYLGSAPLGEGKQRIKVFTPEYGMLSGAYRPRKGQHLQMGTLLQIEWRARLADHLGTLKLEILPQQPLDPLSLAPLPMQALMSMVSLLLQGILERAAEPELYNETMFLLQKINKKQWISKYVHWELMFLHSMGIGFDISGCAVGGNGSLVYLSPKSGRAVSADAGAPYHGQLWPMPACFLDRHDQHPQADYAHALTIIGQFLQKHAAPAFTQLPEIRQSLIEKLTLQ